MNKKFIGLFVILLVGIAILAANTHFQKENLKTNGITSKAVIEKITTNKIDNDFTPSVDNIQVTYAYVVDGEKINKTQEISRHEHDLYFQKTGKVGDSIIIIYDAESPKNSRIEKIAE